MRRLGRRVAVALLLRRPRFPLPRILAQRGPVHDAMRTVQLLDAKRAVLSAMRAA